eukprot:jgi/Botrbrau1/13118/Bobra.0187s0075.1
MVTPGSMEIVPEPIWSLGESMHRPTEVRPGLFLGGLLSLAFVQQLQLTHVLSILEGNLERGRDEELSKVKHMQIALSDLETSDILSHLPGCVDFIREALQSGGRILVHCMAGVSRSATAVTAYLMAEEKLSSEEAVAKLRRVHTRASPNSGFLEQLALLHTMNNKLDEGNWEYRNRLVMQRWRKDGIASSDFPEPSTAPDAVNEATMYRCRTCRRLVATSDNVAPEDLVVKNATHFFYGKRKTSPPSQTAPERTLFVEPLHWMEEVCRGVQGKLYCPQCKARLGSFNWAGTQNSRGSWVTPAFQLHLDRLDVEPPAAAAPPLNIRQPPALS